MSSIDSISVAVAACKLYADAAQYLPHEAKTKLLAILDERRHLAVKVALLDVEVERKAK